MWLKLFRSNMLKNFFEPRENKSFTKASLHMVLLALNLNFRLWCEYEDCASDTVTDFKLKNLKSLVEKI